MPGVQNVIGNHENTIFQRSTAENCTRVNTNSEQGIDCESLWMKGSTMGSGKSKRDESDEGSSKNSLAFS